MNAPMAVGQETAEYWPGTCSSSKWASEARRWPVRQMDDPLAVPARQGPGEPTFGHRGCNSRFDSFAGPCSAAASSNGTEGNEENEGMVHMRNQFSSSLLPQFAPVRNHLGSS